ncbi:DUF2201 family putative metallopeptidase [Rhodoplanes sp. SY1]|uniref:vWA domain-containing protein n=1 Tax=Rhodoplanes sp. SY1 TaxID=3166646 RepID=UPI0038B47CE5
MTADRPDAAPADAPALYEHRGTRAIQRMVEFAPSTGGLALWVRHHDLPADSAAPIVHTDGDAVFYGAAFAGLPLARQTGLVAHEVLHIALRHAQRYVDLQRLVGDVDLELFTICADAIVNSTLDHLAWLELPPGAVTLDRLLERALGEKLTVEAALLAWDVERLYREIDDRRRPEPEGQGRSTRRSDRGASARAGDSDGRPAPADPVQQSEAREDGPRAMAARVLGRDAPADLRPDPAALGAPEAEAEAMRHWSERLVRGHAGDGAFSMLRTLIADLPRSHTPWEQVLRTRLARGLARKPDLSWSRPSRSYLANQGRAGGRRMPWEPGSTTARRVPRLAVVVDVSGSIDDALMGRFADEIDAISRRQEAGLVLVIGDDRVRQVAHREPGRSDLRDIVFDGAGGTDFTPLLEEADRHAPDIIVVLTDLDGPARLRPRAPVIWAVPPAHVGASAPFGAVLVLR